ncbi:family 2 glycosyl transferase [Colletotrichum zoysiae]|uniref:Family 2 glycosyl transferase n=1 Tax=Colletotrichum zoysiae TaxID=1216348 RepID=A0AAD9M6F0_9PEZI|nr:family 2 glycosyl transferase [Colletotrichum zoysiae]
MADIVLGAFWAWYTYDEALAKYFAKKTKPIPLPENPSYQSTDVSIVIATIDTPDSFTDCLRLWLANRPKEIIIVTIDRDLQRVHDLVKPVITEGDDRISVMTADYASKRHQMVVGIKQAKGKILALVDDDAFWNTLQVLPHLLAPFEDPKVGGSFGKQSAHIPVKRRDPAVITPWEVASLRSLDNQNNVQAVRWTADGGCFCMVGRTMVFRAEVAADPRFLRAITTDTWRGKLMNTGDDSFITRWLQTEGWGIAVQNAPEAEITTVVFDDANFLRQLVRWQRSAIQSFLTTAFYEPGLGKIAKKHPYMARKLVERLLRPLLAWIHIFAFIEGFRNNSAMAYFAFFWYVWGWISAYGGFVRRFPFAARHVWACFLLDNAHPVLDLYAWITLSTEAWGTRNEDA